MLAKLGLTSPFNKRKIKELNSSKQLLLQQQQQQQQQAQTQSASQMHHASSSIPTPKRFSASSSSSSSNTAQSQLPVFQNHQSNLQSESGKYLSKTSNLVHNNELATSGLSTKTTANSSRSTSPSNITLTESTLNVSTATSTSQLHINKSNSSKLPQFQMSSVSTSSILKDKRKSSLPKVANNTKNQILQSTQTQSQTLQQPSQTPLTSTPTKIQQNSKLLPPNSIHSTSQTTNSDKTLKRLGSVISQKTCNNNNTIINSNTNITTTTTITTTTPTQSQTQMPVLINSPVQVLNTNKSNTNLTQNQSKQKTSTFGFPKLTKLSTPNLEQQQQQQQSQVNINQIDETQKSQSQAQQQVTPNVISKIPGSFLGGVKSQLKAPSIQITTNSQLKPPSSTNLIKTSGIAGNTITSLSQNITSPTQNRSLSKPLISTPTKKQTTTNLPTATATITKSKLNHTSLTTFQTTSTSNISRISPFGLLNNKLTIKPSEELIDENVQKVNESKTVNNEQELKLSDEANLNETKSSLLVSQQLDDTNNQKELKILFDSNYDHDNNNDNNTNNNKSNNYFDDDDNYDNNLLIGEMDENLIDDNNDEQKFEKFLNSDLKDDDDENNFVNEQINQDNNQDISNRINSTFTIENENITINTTSNELVDNKINTNTNNIESKSSTSSSSSISPPLPSPPSLIQPAHNLIESNKFEQLPTPPPPPLLSITSPKQHHNNQMSINQSSTTSSSSSSSADPSSYLLLAANSTNGSTIQNEKNHILNSLNLNSFGRSNTLDRKLKPLNTIHTNNNNSNNNNMTNNVINSSNANNTVTSNNKNNNQQIKISNNYLQIQQINYQQQQQQRNSLSLNIQLKSPSNTSTSSIYYQPPSITSKRPLSQDTIMELSNELSLSESENLDQSNKNNYMSHSIRISPSNCPPTGTLSKMQHLTCELENAKVRISNLTNQLNSNAQVVYTLEQTVNTLTSKLQSFSLSSQKKDNIINELKLYIEHLQNKYPKILEGEKNQLPRSFYLLNRQNSNESLNSLNSMFSQRSYQSTSISNQADPNHDSFSKNKKKSWLRSSFNKAFNRKQSNRSNKTEECNSVCIDSNNKTFENGNNNNINGKKVCLSDVDENEYSSKSNQKLLEFDNNVTNGYGEYSLPNSPLHQQIVNNQFRRNSSSNPLNNTSFIINQTNAAFNTTEDLEEYQRLLRDKEIKLTDIRLEALATAHQLDQTKEENLKMKIEMEQLKNENIRMQQILSNIQQQNQQSNYHHHQHQQQHMNHHTSPSLISSPSPSASVISSSSNNSKMNLSLSNSSHNVDNLIINNSSSSSSTSSSVSCSLLKSPIANGVLLTETNLNDGKKVIVTIYIGNLDDPLEEIINDDQINFNGQILIGSISINTKTKWDILDGMVKRLFNDYLNKLDSNTVESGGLGLSLDSINYYLVGDMLRKTNDTDQKLPDLLPYGYLVGNHSNIVIRLKDACQNSIDSLCYDTLVPKNVMQRYISLILDYKNLLFCGPSGTSKSYIARKIGEYLAKRQKKDLDTSIVYYDVENKTIKELKQYLNSILEQTNLCSQDQIPIVLILDNLHSITNISDAFMDFFSNKSMSKKCSYIIGTINQSNVTALNLHQNFKWVLCVNHTEPVKNFLTRYLERRLIDQETRLNQTKLTEFEQLIEWIPKLWQNVNKYIELYNSVDLCVGPKIFSTFPIDFKLALEWFVNLWNQTLVPFLIDTIKEGVQVYGTKMNWEDPKIWLAQTLPWLLYDNSVLNKLYSIESHQVGFENESDHNESDAEICLNEETQVNRRVHTSKSNTPLKIKSFSSYPNTPSKISCRNSNENDKLLNMLMKLQEATGLNSQQPNSCFNSIHLETNSNELIHSVKNLSLITSTSSSLQKSLESQL